MLQLLELHKTINLLEDPQPAARSVVTSLKESPSTILGSVLLFGGKPNSAHPAHSNAGNRPIRNWLHGKKRSSENEKTELRKIRIGTPEN
jgi:hypothetical protein